jgi:hypothetical protein
MVWLFVSFVFLTPLQFRPEFEINQICGRAFQRLRYIGSGIEPNTEQKILYKYFETVHALCVHKMLSIILQLDLIFCMF